jgi:hypothetical protein
MTWSHLVAAACGHWMWMEGEGNDIHSLGKQRMGVEVLLRFLAAAHSCQTETEGDNNNAHSFAEQRMGVDVLVLPSGNCATNTTTKTQTMMTTQSPLVAAAPSRRGDRGEWGWCTFLGQI